MIRELGRIILSEKPKSIAGQFEDLPEDLRGC
jgi:hypothetical protein